MTPTGNETPQTRRKKKKYEDPEQSAEEIIDSSDENDVNVLKYVQYKDTNAMNSSLTNLYRRRHLPENDAGDTPTTTASLSVVSGTDLPAQKKRNNRSAKRSKVEASNDADDVDDVAPVTRTLEYSTTTFADVGGFETELTELCKILLRMKNPEIYNTLGAEPPRGFLLHGPPGCGKTLLANAIAGELCMPFIKMAATEVISGVSGESERKIRDVFTQATRFAPCVLFLDEIDAVTPRRETAQREMERRMVSQFVSCLDDLKANGKQVILIGATSRPDALDPALRRAGRFDKEIALGIPDEKSRSRILQVICRKLRVEPDFDFGRLARCCPGYVGADLSSLASEAAACAIDRIFDSIGERKGTLSKVDVLVSKDAKIDAARKELNELLQWIKDGLPYNENDFKELFITMDDFQLALTKVSPSAKREGFATVPDVTWQDIGALSSVREELKWAILYPVQCPEAFESLRLESKPQGILLCGPPGCGKTLLAKAVSNETGMNFISVKGPELINMYVGESERAVRQVFQRARNSAPCVIFFDELDALCPKRSLNESGGMTRVVNQLLTEMDGIEARRQVFIIGATNRPDIIDPAILRPGRLDKLVYVGFPTGPDRHDILLKLTRDDRPRLDRNVDLAAIANDQRAEYYTGADMAALVREASMAALKEYISTKQSMSTSAWMNGDAPELAVAPHHFEVAFMRVKPSVSNKDRQRYQQLERRYLSTAHFADSIADQNADEASTG